MEKNNIPEQVVKYLTKYKEIVAVVDAKNSNRELKELKALIKELQEINSFESINGSKMKNEKASFEDIVTLWKDKKLRDAKGLKLDFTYFTSAADVIHYFEGYTKEEILKSANLLDIKLLYYILTGDVKESKKKKDELFEVISSFIKAQRQGEVFSKWL